MNLSSIQQSRRDDPHGRQPVAEAGAAPEAAAAAVVLLHGRGAGAQGILPLADAINRPDVAYLAPQAAGYTWYPNSFLAPLALNEPDLGSALRAVDRLLARLLAADVPPERTVLLGFSQGACLTLEYAARTPRRYGGVVAFSGGLIGTGEREDRMPPDNKRFEYDGSLEGTPVFIGCSDRDAHVPLSRIEQSAATMQELGGTVVKRIYPGMGHTIVEDEIAYVRDLLGTLTR